MILEREEPTKGGQKSSGSWAGRITKCLGEAEAAVAQGREEGGRSFHWSIANLLLLRVLMFSRSCLISDMRRRGVLLIRSESILE